MRRVLVKKVRQKFIVPKDSHHDANMKVCVEVWLTEEYKQVKEDSLLAWQDEKFLLDISVCFPFGVWMWMYFNICFIMQ